MKAWHKHGACTEDYWGDKNCDRAVKLAPCDVDDKWRVDAFKRPLGAYYRVDHTSIPDMHAAINETHRQRVSIELRRAHGIRPAAVSSSRLPRRPTYMSAEK